MFLIVFYLFMLIAAVSIIIFAIKTVSATARMVESSRKFMEHLTEQISSMRNALIKDAARQEDLAKALENTNAHLLKFFGKAHYIKDRSALVQAIEQAFLSSDVRLAKKIICRNLHIRYEISKVEYLNDVREIDKTHLSEINLLLRLAQVYEIQLPKQLENLQSFKNYKRQLSYNPPETSMNNNLAFGKPIVYKPMHQLDARNPGKKK